MRLADIIALASNQPTERIITFIQSRAGLDPELADLLLTELRGADAAENLQGILDVLPGEIANIKALRLDPREHPSDVVGG